MAFASVSRPAEPLTSRTAPLALIDARAPAALIRPRRRDGARCRTTFRSGPGAADEPLVRVPHTRSEGLPLFWHRRQPSPSAAMIACAPPSGSDSEIIALSALVPTSNSGGLKTHGRPAPPSTATHVGSRHVSEREHPANAAWRLWGLLWGLCAPKGAVRCRSVHPRTA